MADFCFCCLLYYCAGFHISAVLGNVLIVLNILNIFEASVAVDKSVLQQVHLEASLAVHEVMLELHKACGH